LQQKQSIPEKTGTLFARFTFVDGRIPSLLMSLKFFATGRSLAVQGNSESGCLRS